ncbi:MAG TPA: elongation factor P [Phycisphaerae bacterium]|nr:elongation factor P [Phycisphaerae bacterium]
MIGASDLRVGRAIIYEGEIYTVKECQHTAKGNWRSYMVTKLKHLKTGKIIDARFAMSDKIDTPFLESKEYEYLYTEGDHLVLMDTQTYDQIQVPTDVLGDGIQFLKPNEKVTCQLSDGNILTIDLPNTVELTVTDTPPVVKGATATNQPKDAILETGARVRVPAFIEPGEVVRVDTRTGEYIERAKK